MELISYKQAILAEIPKIEKPVGIEDVELIDSYKRSKAIENILLPVFRKANLIQLQISDSIFQNGLRNILQRFETEVMASLEGAEKQLQKGKNIFEEANAVRLSLSNKYTRVISENLGHKLEDIANLSPRVINPEQDYNLRMKGVDIILFNEDQFHYCQLKTKKDTLTGSQAPRSQKELEIYSSSKFVACLSLGKGWTFKPKTPNIQRIAGSDFWGILDMNYDVLVQQVSESILKIEHELYL